MFVAGKWRQQRRGWQEVRQEGSGVRGVSDPDEGDDGAREENGRSNAVTSRQLTASYTQAALSLSLFILSCNQAATLSPASAGRPHSPDCCSCVRGSVREMVARFLV